MSCSRLRLSVGLSVVVLLVGACALRPGPVPALRPSQPAVTSSPRSLSEHVRVVRGPENATTVLLPVTINGQGPFTFALDTGASNSLIDASLAQRVGLLQAGPPRSLEGVGGVERAIPVRVERWSSGPITLPALTISAAQLPNGRRGRGLEGLVGSDVWDGLGRFTLDYRSETLTVYT